MTGRAVLLWLASIAMSAPTLASQGTARIAIDLPAEAASAQHGSPGDGIGEGTKSPSIRTLDVLGDGQTHDLLNAGFPARLHYRLDLWRQSGIFNSIDGTFEWNVIVRYDPIRKRYRAVRVYEDSAAILGDFEDFRALGAAIAAPVKIGLPPGRHGGRYYYNVTLDVEMLSLNDLDEVERWLRGELEPAVKGQRNPGGVIGRGLRTLFVKLLGAERRHYEVRSGSFKKQ